MNNILCNSDINSIFCENILKCLKSESKDNINVNYYPLIKEYVLFEIYIFLVIKIISSIIMF